MRIAIFSDVHGNKHALEAVLADIRNRGPGRVVCLGDLVGYGAYPDAVVQAVRESGIPTVMGNYDDAIANRRMVCGCDYKDEQALEAGVKSISWTLEHTGEASREFLLGLPERIVEEIHGRRVLFVHGSPRRLNEYLYEDAPAAGILPMLQEAKADVLVCGHTHLPYHRVVDGRHIINAGSAGKPKHGDPQAVYALVDMGKDIRVEFIKVPYDCESAARAVEKAGLPAEFAAILRTGIG
ncbi:metallophosphoesterase family protein [Desulfotruncus alcoholivorax]|uniref:metallophosphoesterase family protein n=1 Tax=Desulfotruncus alcoholivorax TaxID=265477 RepID=UPI00042A22C0|nr:metallophosphoesterase family protein [Desulfotruncus alcoholivorax]